MDSVLVETFRKYGLGDNIRRYRIWPLWEEMVGKNLAEHCKPTRIVGKTLNVMVSDPVWSQHLSLIKPEILKKINIVLEEDVIDDIRFVVGDMEKRALKTESKRRRHHPIKEEIPPELDEKIRRDTASCKDKEIRSLLVRIFYNFLKTRPDRGFG